jgi:hypothetical protein
MNKTLSIYVIMQCCYSECRGAFSRQAFGYFFTRGRHLTLSLLSLYVFKQIIFVNVRIVFYDET